MVGEQLARDQDLPARLVDVGIHCKVVLVGELGAALQHFRRAALRRKRRDRPVQGAAGRVTPKLVLEIVELLADRPRLVAEHGLDVGRQAVLVADHPDRRNIPQHRREHDANPRLAIGIDHDVGVVVVERNEPQHVLHGGDAAPQALQRPDQGAGAHLVLAAVGAHRQRVKQPHFERQLLEQPAAQRVVRVVMRIDQAGHHQPAGCVDRFVHALAGEIGTDRGDRVAFDQDIGERRLMDVAFMVIDLAAADQRCFRRHAQSIEMPVASIGAALPSICARAG